MNGIYQAQLLEYNITEKDEIPADFRNFAAKFCDTVCKFTNKSAIRMGVGGSVLPFFTKTAKKIKEEDTKRAYVFIMPMPVRIKFLDAPKEWRNTCRDICKSSGMKVASSIKSGIQHTDYWYKYSPDKKYIYIAYYLSPGSSNIYTLGSVHTQMQIYLQCSPNCEATKNTIFKNKTPDGTKDVAGTRLVDYNESVLDYYCNHSVELI